MKKKEIKKYSNVLGIDLGGASRNGLALYSNKDKKLLENMLFEGSKIDVDENGIKIHGPEVYQKKTLLSEDPDEAEEDR